MRILFVLLLAGTAHAQQIGSPEYWDLIHERCVQYGYTPGSEGFAHCRMNLDQTAKQRMRDRENMILQQGIQDDAQRRYRQMPLCSQLPPGMRGFYQAQGACR